MLFLLILGHSWCLVVTSVALSSNFCNFKKNPKKTRLLRNFKNNKGIESHVKSFIESEVPYLRLFLMLNMMPLKNWVATQNVLTVLLGNEVWSKFLLLVFARLVCHDLNYDHWV